MKNNYSARDAGFIALPLGAFPLFVLMTCASPTSSALAGACAVPTFAPARTFSSGGMAVSVAVKDFNQDGKLDVALATRDGVSLLAGEGNGNFGAPVVYPAGRDPVFITVADFNGDGKADIAVVNQGSKENNFNDGGVSVLLGTGDRSGQQTGYAAAEQASG